TQREQLRRIVDTIPDAVLISDRTGRYVQANAAAEALFGLSADEILRCTRQAPPWKRFTLGGERLPDGAIPSLQVAVTGGVQRDAEYVLERADGTRLIVSGSAAPLED